MLKSWRGKVLLGIYISGYWVHIIMLGVREWSNFAISTWWFYMAYQAMLGVIWPILMMLSWFGIDL